MKKINFDLVFKILVLFFLCVIFIFMMSEHNYNSDSFDRLDNKINSIENQNRNQLDNGRYMQMGNNKILDTRTGKVTFPDY